MVGDLAAGENGAGGGRWWAMVGIVLSTVRNGGGVFELCLSPVWTGSDFFGSRSTVIAPVVTGKSHFGREWLSPVPTGSPEFPGILVRFSPPVPTG